MHNEFQVLGLQFHWYNMKEAMIKVAEYLDHDVINTIEIVTYETLLQEQFNTEWMECINRKDIVIAGDDEILKAAGIVDRSNIRDVNHAKLVRTILQYINKNKKTVFVLAPSKEALSRFHVSISNYVRHLHIVGTEILEEDPSKEEIVINKINGLDADCILSILPSPYQESFIHKNQSLLHSRLWFGCGTFFDLEHKLSTRGGRIISYLKKKMFHYRVDRHNKMQ